MKTFYHKTEQRIVKSFDNPDSNIWSEEPIPISSSKSQLDNVQVNKQDNLFLQNVIKPVDNFTLSSPKSLGEETQTPENIEEKE